MLQCLVRHSQGIQLILRGRCSPFLFAVTEPVLKVRPALGNLAVSAQTSGTAVSWDSH